jgi:amino acid adenylation domain-containing protein
LAIQSTFSAVARTILIATQKLDHSSLAEGEMDRLLSKWNQTQMPYAEDTCIHQFFEAQVARTPDLIAVVFKEVEWTYRELNIRSDALAMSLKSAGIGPGSLVGVALHRSPELVAALLAVLKAGAAYVPLDPSYPPQRLGLMLEDARPALVIASRHTAQIIPKSTCLTLHVEDFDVPSVVQGVMKSGASSSDPAYVIYTSGSTGKPKGVVVTHRNVANFFAAMDAIIGVEPGVWLAVTSVSFDISVFELFWTLARGFSVVMQEEGQLASTSGLAYSLPEQMHRHRVTHLQCTPSLASILTRDPKTLDALRPLRRLIVGGEALPLDLARKLSLAISGEMFNVYGPTETTIWSTACRIEHNVERILIGHPIANTQLYVLDSMRQVVPIGEPGELYIGGAGVAAGYLRQPELTGERFVTNPFSNDAGLLYRTGDIVRYEHDGSVEFLGRADQQIKIRGFRIELGEIELVLRKHPHIRDAVVVVRKDVNNENDKRLVGYVIADGREVITGWELREWLRGQLPETMVPSTVMLVEGFPQTPNGKVDRNALPEPETNTDPELEPASNDLEESIAAIWADVLDVPTVSVTRGFFDLGGHSLLMAEVHDQIQDKIGVQVPLIELFHHPTVRSFATYLTQKSAVNSASNGTARGQLRQKSQMRRAAGRKRGTTTKS